MYLTTYLPSNDKHKNVWSLSPYNETQILDYLILWFSVVALPGYSEKHVTVWKVHHYRMT